MLADIKPLGLALLALACFAATREARSETYQADLTGLVADAHPEADYLQAAFSFPGRFRTIDAVRIEFETASGISEGNSTGNSSSFYWLTVDLHSPRFDAFADRITGSWFLPPGLARTDFDVAIERQLLQVYPWKNVLEIDPYSKLPDGTFPPDGEYPADTVFTPFWPEFLYAGQGLVTVQSFAISSYHPIGLDGDTTDFSSIVGRLKPPPVTSATLFVTGTLVPEPAAWVLAAISLAALRRRPGHCR